ncbi:MAG: DNA primase large subunit PriL [Methanomassiliicoccales archaeon]|nr:MAG: DNA primase large subunit PriL [Methanomassiliicoccales archaeon]
METQLLSRYPFLKAASELVRSSNVSLDELLTHRAYEGPRARGKQRVMDALNDLKVGLVPTSSDEGAILLEVLSYPVARVLVSCVADEFLVRRYALAEAKTMHERLETEDLDIVVEVAEDLGVTAHRDGDVLSMHFCDFLRYTSGLRGKEWKLVNHELRKGFVVLPKKKFARVLEQALAEKIGMELPLPVSDDIMEAMAKDVAEITAVVSQMRERMKEQGFGEVSITKFPPCMKKLTVMAEKGENMPHAGRFAITTFLSALGMSNDDIVKTFFSSPDFDNSMTVYQVRHITGDGMGKRYSCPECATMRTNGLCIDMDDLCRSGKVRHPLGYYRIRSMEQKRRPRPEESEQIAAQRPSGH